MALSSNALTTVNSLRAYMRTSPNDVDMMAIYHDASASATEATVQVLATGIRLIITGGTNAGTQNILFADEATVTAVVAAIDALSEGWVVNALAGWGAVASTDLNTQAATDAYGSAATQYLRGTDTYNFEQQIDAASDMIEEYCSRTFASASYKHRFHGSGNPRLRLRHLPVTAVSRIALGTRAGLRVRNTTSDAQMATVQNDRTDLTFTIYGGTSDTRSSAQTVTLATYTTMADVITAIDALGNGWDAQTVGSTENAWKSADLLIFQPWNCLNSWIDLPVPDEWLDDYTLTGGNGIIERGVSQQFFTGTRFLGGHYASVVYNPASPAMPHSPGGHPGALWPYGSFNVYVEYTAGYSATPDSVEQACNKLAANLIRGGSHDGSLSSMSGPEFSESCVY
jgi:hypothetical protein